MDSRNILENFLLSRLGLESVISFDDFQKAHGDVDPEALLTLYNTLSRQRQRAVLDPIRAQIKDEFNIPTESLKTTTAQALGYTVQRLTEDLKRLKPRMEAIGSILDDEIQKELNDINGIIGKLKQLLEHELFLSEEQRHTFVESTLASVDRCEDLFKEK